MFVDKQELISIFKKEFEAWERLLGGLNTSQITSPSLHNGMSIKDTMAHLAAWQRRGVAQIEATLHNHAPNFPPWPVEVDEEETPDAVDRANAWILEANRDRPWADVHEEWRDGFLRFLELVRTIPESDLRSDGKLAWLAEFQPSEVLPRTYDMHHSEHRGLLEAWLRIHTAP